MLLIRFVIAVIKMLLSSLALKILKPTVDNAVHISRYEYLNVQILDYRISFNNPYDFWYEFIFPLGK